MWRSLVLMGAVLLLFGCIDAPSGEPAAPPPEGVVVYDGGFELLEWGRPDREPGQPPRDRGPGRRDAAQPMADRGAPAVDRGPRPVDARPPDCRSVGEPIIAEIELPLGETLFFDGDDYLAFWGISHPCPPRIDRQPGGSTARIEAGARLTPDATGEWVIGRGDDRVTVSVRDDLLDEDTFLNFNYSPSHPLAAGDPGWLWVASPQSNTVQAIDVDADGSPRAGEPIPVGAWPTSVAWWADARMLLVTQTARDSLGVLDADRGALVDAIPVGDEPAAVVLDASEPGRRLAWVALSGADAVAAVDLDARRVIARIETGRDPRALALDPARGRLYVASMLSSNAHPQGRAESRPPPESTRRDITVIDTRQLRRIGFVPEVGTLLRGLWLDPDNSDRLVVSLTHARNRQATIQATSRPQAHGLAVVDVGGDDPARFPVEPIDLDRRQPAPGPFSLAGTPDGRWLLTSLSAGNALLVLDRDSLAERTRLPAGATPRGLAFTRNHVWTYAWLDDELLGWPLADLESGRAEPLRLIVGADPTPPRIKAGQRIYYDATFSARGDFACNSCHPDGLVDGLVWNLLLDGDVNTLPFRNVGGTDPFLWGGQLPTLFDFSREVLRLVGATATGEQMELLTEYIQSVTAPPNPHTLPGGRFTASAQRGRAVFEAVGCVACHSGPLLTNRQRVVGKTPGLQTDVPSLIGVYDTGPWGREGQWYTMEEIVDAGLDFVGADVAPGQRDDLVDYIRQLPGDLLYLTSARPLSGSRSVYHRVPIELAFNGVLAPGQADAFALERQVGDGWRPVPGRWRISGRYARFEGGELPFESTFRIRVDAALQSTLGQRLGGAITVGFETGQLPELDSTGRWSWVLSGAVGGTVEIALLQATGGHVSGALIDGDGIIDLDHLEGFVSGTTLFIDPFPVLSPFGEVMVESAEIELEDIDGDGFADRGEGIVITPFVDLDLTARRIGP